MRPAERAVAALTARRLSLAVAESLTGGALTAAVVDVPGASAVLRGGVVAYSADLKASLLDVDPALLEDGGPVQAEVARQMAEGVRRRLGADVGVATTGVAGPGPADGASAGTAYVAVRAPGQDSVRPFLLTGSRRAVRAAVTRTALALLLQAGEHGGRVAR